MNPLTNTKNQNVMNLRELSLGYTGTASSWHRQYKDSAWIFIGGLNFELTEGDIICVFSQYGEVVNINLVRDKQTGKSKGFAFLCYEDQRSTVLATDNLNGIKVAGRIIRVDHVEKYRVPTDGTVSVKAGNKSRQKELVPDADPDFVASFVRERGCGPDVMKKLKRIEKEIQAVQQERIKQNELEQKVKYERRSHSPYHRKHKQVKHHGSSSSRKHCPNDRGSKLEPLSPPRKYGKYIHPPARVKSEELSPARSRNLSPPRRR